MPERINRGGLLARGAVLLASGSTVAALAAPAKAATPDADLAYLRLLIGAELLKLDFHERVLASKRLDARRARLVRRMLLDDRAHYKGLAALLTAAGQTAATPGDIDFSYPRGSFAAQTPALKLGRQLASLALGAYLGAVENVQTPQLRLPMAQIAANEAQQVGAYSQLHGGPIVGSAFAASLQIDAVSKALDVFES